MPLVKLPYENNLGKPSLYQINGIFSSLTVGTRRPMRKAVLLDYLLGHEIQKRVHTQLGDWFKVE